MRIIVDPNRCTGLGMCEAVAEDVFCVNDDGSLELLQDEVGEERRADMQAAVEACPTEAIRLVD